MFSHTDDRIYQWTCHMDEIQIKTEDKISSEHKCQ